MQLRLMGLVATGLLAALPCASQAQIGTKATDAQLLSAWSVANSECRGGSDPAKVERVCREREQLSARLEARGYCYGKRGEFGYQATWHRCTPSSCGIVDC